MQVSSAQPPSASPVSWLWYPSTPTAVGLSALPDFSCWLSQWGLRSGSSPPKLELSTEHMVLKTAVTASQIASFSLCSTKSFRQKEGGQRANCLQLKTILRRYFGVTFWSPSIKTRQDEEKS